MGAHHGWMTIRLLAVLGLTWVSQGGATAARAAEGFAVQQQDDSVVISLAGRPVAEFVHRDERIPRPYLTHLHAPDGTRVSRHHPPRPGVDPVDHAELHPGIGWAFGDLNGVDFWRNKGRVKFVRFAQTPVVRQQAVDFAVEDRWLAPSGEEVCRGSLVLSFLEGARLDPPVRGTVILTSLKLVRDAGPLTFGPQHEMGVGLRVATPLMVKAGTGQIRGSHGGTNETGNWGRAGTWWDYSGTTKDANGQAVRAGMLLVLSPDNARPCWAHARDYGFLAVNPTGPPPDRKDVPSLPFTIPAGTPFEMRWGIVLHSNPEANSLDLEQAAQTVGQRLRDWPPDTP